MLKDKEEKKVRKKISKVTLTLNTLKEWEFNILLRDIIKIGNLKEMKKRCIIV